MVLGVLIVLFLPMNLFLEHMPLNGVCLGAYGLTSQVHLI